MLRAFGGKFCIVDICPGSPLMNNCLISSLVANHAQARYRNHPLIKVSIRMCQHRLCVTRCTPQRNGARSGFWSRSEDARGFDRIATRYPSRICMPGDWNRPHDGRATLFSSVPLFRARVWLPAQLAFDPAMTAGRNSTEPKVRRPHQ